jgi:peptidoglycan/LPS O-acetylase OafA/YrhL
MQHNSSISYIKDIDGLRAVAVLMVIVGHWWESQYSTFLGFAGVTLFFVISGFLITSILMQYKAKTEAGTKSKAWYFKTFYIRRTLRIFPIYYLYLGYMWWLGYEITQRGMIWFVAYAGNHFNYNVGYFLVQKSHLWSLAVEEQFYLIWPLLILLCPPTYFKQFFVGVIAFSLAFKGYIYLNASETLKPAFMYMLTPACFDAFAIGALLSLNQVQRFISDKLIYILGGASMLILYLMYAYANHLGVIYERVLYSVGSAALILLAIHRFKGGLKLFLSNSIMIQIGKVSYGLYLYHLAVPFIHYRFVEYLKGIGKDTSAIQSPFGEKAFFILSTLVIVFVSWHFIEKPINNLKRYFK